MQKREADDHDETTCAERDGNQKNPVHRPVQSTHHTERRQLDETRDCARWRQWRHRFFTREAGEIGKQHERIAASAKTIDQRTECRDSLTAIAATIVQKHNASTRSAIEY